MKMHRGFTLIELMITVAVIAILAAIAIPSYQKYRLKTNRPIGEQCLVEAQRRIENAYAHLNSYPATTLNSPSYGYSSDPVNCGDPPYVYTVSLSFPASATCPAAACYQLTASPSPSQAKDGTLLLTYNAQKLDPSQRFYKQHIPPGSSTPVTTWDFQPGQ